MAQRGVQWQNIAFHCTFSPTVSDTASSRNPATEVKNSLAAFIFCSNSCYTGVQ